MNSLEEQYRIDLAVAEKNQAETNATYTNHSSYHLMMRSRAYNAVHAVHAEYQRKLKGHSKIVPLLKKAGLPIAKSTSTAIRGHRDYTLGFKVQSDSDGVRIYFQHQGYTSLGTYRELTLQQKAKAIDVLIEAGYELNINPSRIEILSYNPLP